MFLNNRSKQYNLIQIEFVTSFLSHVTYHRNLSKMVDKSYKFKNNKFKIYFRLNLLENL